MKLNQNVNLAMFHLWPGLLALIGLASPRRTIAMIVLFAAIAAVIAMSNHDSSQVALVASSLVVLLAWKWRTLVIRSLAVAWCAAFVLVVPASFTAYDNGLHFANWLPDSARARIILWEYTAEQVLNRPLFGVGVDSTPRLSAQQKATFAREQPEGFVYPRTMGHHAPQHIHANLVRARRGRVRCSWRWPAQPWSCLSFSSHNRAAICRGSLCGLRRGRRLRLGHVAIVVHVCRGLAANLSSRRKRRALTGQAEPKSIS